jgi:HK97 gp10 family phage protein
VAFMSAKLLNREKVMASLIRMVPEAETELAAAQLSAGKMLAGRIRPRTPLSTGRYRRSIKADKLSNHPKSQNRLIGIRATKDKNAVGIFALFTWHWLEFGTVHMAAQPHIFPTYRGAKKEIRRAMANAVNKVVRRRTKLFKRNAGL